MNVFFTKIGLLKGTKRIGASYIKIAFNLDFCQKLVLHSSVCVESTQFMGGLIVEDL